MDGRGGVVTPRHSRSMTGKRKDTESLERADLLVTPEISGYDSDELEALAEELEEEVDAPDLALAARRHSYEQTGARGSGHGRQQALRRAHQWLASTPADSRPREFRGVTSTAAAETELHGKTPPTIPPTLGGETCGCPFCTCDIRVDTEAQRRAKAAALVSRVEWALGSLAELRAEGPSWAPEAQQHYQASIQAHSTQALAHLSLGAMRCKTQGLDKRGVEALAAAAGFPGACPGSCEAQTGAARAAQQLLAVSCLLASDRDGLTSRLTQMGYRYSLSPSLFQQPSALSTPRLRKSEEEQKVAVSEDALPAELFERIRAGLEWSTRPDGFWRQHLYGHHCTSYHSYIYALDDPPSNAIEEAAQLLRPALQRKWAAVEGAVAMEWWVHARRPFEGHQLHFDLDEARAAAGDGLQHPILSSVLFLSSAGGPTLITSQRLGDGIRPDLKDQLGWLVRPVCNRLAVFDGRLLHGVLPGVAPAKSDAGRRAAPSQGERRMTLMMAWHGPGVRPQTSGPPLGPLRPLGPRQGAAWLTSLGPEESSGVERQRSREPRTDWLSPAPLRPLWEDLSPPGAAIAHETRKGLLGEGLRYFASTATDFERLYCGGRGQPS